MRITSHPLRGPAATKAVRNSRALDPAARVHLRFIDFDDALFVTALSPGPSPAARRGWIAHAKELQAQGREFNFVIVENGCDRGLVRMHDFTTIGGESSFGWGDFISQQAGLLTAIALSIYSLGFDALGFARAHMIVPRSSPDLSIFHLSTGAELEYEDADTRHFRFSADTYHQILRDALQRRTVTISERA